MTANPPFATIAPGDPSYEAARLLKATIEAAWEQQGKRVACRIEAIQYAGRPIYEIRSNLINGLPQ